MTNDELHLFLDSAAVVCALGVVLNLFMVFKRGTRAYWMAGAFLALGITVSLLRYGANAIVVGAGATIVCGLLIGDSIAKLKKREVGR